MPAVPVHDMHARHKPDLGTFADVYDATGVQFPAGGWIINLEMNSKRRIYRVSCLLGTLCNVFLECCESGSLRFCVGCQSALVSENGRSSKEGSQGLINLSIDFQTPTRQSGRRK